MYCFTVHPVSEGISEATIHVLDRDRINIIGAVV